MIADMIISDEEVTYIELKTLKSVFDLEDLRVIQDSDSSDRFPRTEVFSRFLKQLRENLRVQSERHRTFLRALERLCSLDKKKEVAVHYLKLLALRPLLRMRILLRQKLAHSAPVVGLVLRNRARYIFATRPSIAPPKFA